MSSQTDRYRVMTIDEQGNTNLELYRGPHRESAYAIVRDEASGYMHGVVVIDQVDRTADYGDRIEAIGGAA